MNNDNILDDSTNSEKHPVIIFDIDGTLTPHEGGCGECMFCKGWNVYSQEYKNLEETILLQKLMKMLRENDFIILYNSNNRQENILYLLDHLGISPDGGNSREYPLSKIEYIKYIQSQYKHNNIYYLDDDHKYLINSKVRNISCNNGWWLGKQIKTIIEYLKIGYILPEEVRDFHKLLRMLSDDILLEFM